MKPEWFRLVLALAVWSAGAIPAAAETIVIAIDGLAFQPVEIAARVGDTLEWINHDPFLHSATADGSWDVEIEPEKRATLTLEKAGSFDYICRYHPNMTGHVTVTER